MREAPKSAYATRGVCGPDGFAYLPRAEAIVFPLWLYPLREGRPPFPFLGILYAVLVDSSLPTRLLECLVRLTLGAIFCGALVSAARTKPG